MQRSLYFSSAMIRGGEMTRSDIGRLAVLWRGDREKRRSATPPNDRFHHVFEELAELGVHAEPAVYDEDLPTQCASSS
jgi:hypothetical protein